ASRMEMMGTRKLTSFPLFFMRSPPPYFPAMARLISSMGGFLPENTPMICPSNITTMRSETSRISSKSAEISNTPQPLSRASIMVSWTKRVAPISRPRVGWTAT
ncbi:DUF2007 domain-containing protein, partial [Dysosmobacter welbionis]